MAEVIDSALPPELDLGGSWVIEWDAVDPSTGDSVPDVIVSDTSLLVDQLAGPPVADHAATPYLLVPGPAA